MRLLSFLALGFLAASSTTVLAQSVGVGLPIDDEAGTPGIVSVWPNEGCPDCVRAPALVSAYETARDAILSGNAADVAKLHPRIVRIIEYSEKSGAGSYTSSNVSLAQLSARLKGCSPTAQGMVPPNPKSELKTFGIGADCPGKETRAFMSLSFKDNKLTTVFLMPDRPFLVQLPARSERGN